MLQNNSNDGQKARLWPVLGLAALISLAISPAFGQTPNPPGGSSGGGGSGCTTAGSDGSVLTDDGVGGCNSDGNALLANGALALGESGTLGTVTFGNATSGTILLQPVDGALGASTLSLPAETATIATLAAGNIPVSALVSDSVAVNGQTCTLGGSCTVSAAATGVTVGTTTISGGTSHGVLYDNAGVIGNLASGNSGVLVTSGAGVPSISTTLPSGLALGTPGSVTLTNGTGLPLGGLTGLGTGVATWLGTPSSANLAAAVTGETGSGALVFGTSPSLTSPTLTTPNIGAATATSVNYGGQTCSHYDEGSWTPADSSGVGVSITVISANYTRICNLVFAYANITVGTSASGSGNQFGGLPFTSSANDDHASSIPWTDALAGNAVSVIVNGSSQNFRIFTSVPAQAAWSQLSGKSMYLNIIYSTVN